jgi:pyruvate kinase
MNTSIICTIGPSIRFNKILEILSNNNVSIIRINFSHGTFENHKNDINLIKTFNEIYKKNIKILIDLEGHRIRVCNIENNEVSLKKGQKLIVTNKKNIGNDKIIQIDYNNSLVDIKKNTDIFIDDGNLVLKVLSSSHNELITEVQTDHILKEHKGVNIPSINLKFDKLENKEREAVLFALENDVDFIANSFVRSVDDIKPIIDILNFYKNKKCKLISKIEDIFGINNIDDIINSSDGIMIARGDMGVSIPLWHVPIVQKIIIKKCKNYGKFVITATQMLESMIKNQIPTRAEISDIANAVLDGTDYTMLSAESSIGKYPEKSVEIMNNVIKYIENNKYKLELDYKMKLVL